MMDSVIRIGTRGSPLALVQAHTVDALLREAHPDCRTEIVVIKTTGDKVTDRPLAEIGGKGLFTKELDTALVAGDIACAVHSMKDMETALADGIDVAAVLPREDPRDAFLSPVADRIADLPEGAVVGTTSLRRQAQILDRRPDLSVVTFRGNVDTRLEKLRAGTVQATLLAMAGLNRLGRTDVGAVPLEPDELLPAAAQGAVAITVRAGDTAMQETMAPLDHRETNVCVTTERAFLAALDGTCKTPIAALARMTENNGVSLHGLVATPDGTVRRDGTRTASASEIAVAAHELGIELKAAMGSRMPL